MSTNSIPYEANENPAVAELPGSAYNDTGNAAALIEAYGDKIRFVPGWGWLVYDGKRWQRDAEHQVIEHAKQTIQAMFWRAGQTEDKYERDRLLSHANASLALPRLRAMVELAKSDKRVRAEVTAFDADPWLFNCTNGTLDLRTGELLPHTSGHFITQVSPIAYDHDARSPMFEAFVLDVSDNRPDLAEYLRQAMGYSLTGLTSEKGFFFAFGATGDNGKSTLLEAMLHVMGDYGAAVAPQIILSKNGISGNAEHDLIQLVGKRYVITSEPEEGDRFRMGQIKRLTGGDTMTARYHYQEAFRFTPRLKLWFAANRRPEVPESNDAAWNRIKFIPFDMRVSADKKDPKLGEKLREAAPAILAWAVQGCLAWQDSGGLSAPACMLEATKDYRADQDSFRAFLDECCELPSDEDTRISVIRERYADWKRDNDPQAPDLSQKTIRTALEEHGIKVKRVTGGRMALGLGLKRAETTGAERQSYKDTARSYENYAAWDDTDEPYF